MTKMTNNNYNARHITRSTDRARAITKAKSKKQNIFIATIAGALVAVVAAGCFAFGAFNATPKTAATTSTAVSAKADGNRNDNKAAQNTKQNTQQTAVQQAYEEVQQTSNRQNDQENTKTALNEDNNNNNTQTSEDKIETINGERVYIDTKRKAPDKTGTPAHYYAYGKTSYGFDWDYDADDSNFAIRCDYNFDEQQYDFNFYGVTPGTSHVTLYYNTDDNTRVPVNLTVNVDNDLNITLA